MYFVYWCGKFFFNDTATTEIYTLSLHGALPISSAGGRDPQPLADEVVVADARDPVRLEAAVRAAGGPADVTVVCVDRKSTRLNSSHANISYAVFCLKKKTPSAIWKTYA